MLLLRSILFTIAFYVATAIEMIVFTPFYFLGSRKFAWKIVHFWAGTLHWLMKVIVGTRYEITGTEHLTEGGYIIAPKHQSAWDTVAFLPHWPNPTYILKRELMWVPLFGWYMQRMGMIPIDRSSRDKAIASINAGGGVAISENKQIIIYPEGTRKAPGAEPAYKQGIAHLYVALGVPVVPMAHVAGLYWPRNSWMKYPGTIKVEVLEPIQPGLSRAEFMKELMKRTEDAVDRLLLEAANDPKGPPLPDLARKRVAELRGAKHAPVSAGS